MSNKKAIIVRKAFVYKVRTHAAKIGDEVL